MTWKEKLVFLLLILNVADVYFTKLALENGYIEANPLMDYVIKTLGGLGTVLVFKLVFLGVLFFLIEKYQKNRLIDSLIIFATFVYAVLYGWHMYLMFTY